MPARSYPKSWSVGVAWHGMHASSCHKLMGVVMRVVCAYVVGNNQTDGCRFEIIVLVLALDGEVDLMCNHANCHGGLGHGTCTA